ncbi:uncharacterized protein LOC142163143 [Nicotiana tabacum]|uniref:Uncharacterized protein LOC142163143 n=1 Tax=Nicotiana tabacum TaxID=4097 RepID=A0AC58RUV6_TOBAC
MIQKILKARQYIEEAGLNMDNLLNMDRFSIKKMYLRLRGNYPKVAWRRLLCNNQECPRWLFTLTLVAHGRLNTKDKLVSWGVRDEQVCPLCEEDNESINHFFFSCVWSANVWVKLLQWLGIHRAAMCWQDELKWAILHMRRKTVVAIYRMVLAGSIYFLWQERNLRIFQAKRRSFEVVTRLIVQEMFCRGSMQNTLARKMEQYNHYP